MITSKIQLLICAVALVFTVSAVLAPLSVSALGVDKAFEEGGIGGTVIPCGNDDDDKNRIPDNECEFGHLILGLNRVIQWLIWFSVPVAGIMFAYAGILMVTSGGSEGQISKAKSIFWNVGIGFFFVLAAWLIVELITSVLLREGFLTNFFTNFQGD